MFDNDIKLVGKHATYVKFLSKKTSELNKNFVGAEVFKRYIDVYIAGAIFGLLKKRRADVDNSTNGDTANILAAVVINEQSSLKFLYRLVLLLHESNMTNDERVDFAFRNDSNSEQVKKGMEIFNSYARGGIEWLYENFTEGATTKEDYLQKISEIVSDFADMYDIK